MIVALIGIWEAPCIIANPSQIGRICPLDRIGLAISAAG
jgi:hypothetical protein